MTRHLKKDIWPELVTLSGPDSDIVSFRRQIEVWLRENISQFGDQWYIVYNYKTTDYYFKDSREATLFALRWA